MYESRHDVCSVTAVKASPFIYDIVIFAQHIKNGSLKEKITGQVKEYFESKEYLAETFDTFSLNGTPSTILVDREGILRDVSFGISDNLEKKVQELL